MDIGDVARHSGVSVSALRFYEQKGLIAPVGRHGLRRVFDETVLQRLALISLGRAAGFSLSEIATIFDSNGHIAIDRRMLANKADELDKTIRRLQAMRDGLRHAAACPKRRHVDCPSFQRLLKRAIPPRVATR